MNLNRIYILTQAVNSGKTTTLQQWLRNKNIKAGGILTPDKDGKRHIYDIAEDKYYGFEVDGSYPEEHTLEIGKYRFSKEGFEIAQQILLRSLKQDTEWLIIDEVGKLELEERTGLEPAVSQVIKAYSNGQTKGSLLLVIRNYLLDEAVAAYGLNTDMILNQSFFE
jgi:nucleoside-triphosphatase THEP1